jgi:branched-chain amino acid aminotransferase
MYYNENTIIYFDGKFIKAEESRGNLYDQSLHYGYSVFEGIRAYETKNGTRIFKAKEHFDRMKFSADAISMPYPFDNDELIEASYEVLRRNGLTDAYLRPLVSATPNMSLTKGISSQIMILAWAWGAYLGDKTLNLMTSSYRRICPASFKVEAKVSGHYVKSILQTQEATSSCYDVALMLVIDGYVAEGPGANVFIEKSGILYTPQLGSILPGITRATVLEIADALDIEVIEKKISPEEMREADSAFYCGTAAEVIGIASLDKKSYKKNWNDSLGAIIQKAYKDLVLEKEFSQAIA